MLYALDPFVYDPVIKEGQESNFQSEESRYWFAQGHLFRYWTDPFTSALNVGIQGIQGIASWRVGLYGATTPLVAVFAIEMLIASAIIGTIGYIVDPLDRYEGGLAEYLTPKGQQYAKEVWLDPGILIFDVATPTANYDPKFDIGMRWGQL